MHKKSMIIRLHALLVGCMLLAACSDEGSPTTTSGSGGSGGDAGSGGAGPAGKGGAAGKSGSPGGSAGQDGEGGKAGQNGGSSGKGASAGQSGAGGTGQSGAAGEGGAGGEEKPSPYGTQCSKAKPVCVNADEPSLICKGIGLGAPGYEAYLCTETCDSVDDCTSPTDDTAVFCWPIGQKKYCMHPCKIPGQGEWPCPQGMQCIQPQGAPGICMWM